MKRDDRPAGATAAVAANSRKRVDNGAVKIYTRTGDSGETGLFDGTRVSKSDPRVATYGDVDELNAWLGLVRAGRPMASSATCSSRSSGTCSRSARAWRIPASRIAARVTKAAVTAEDITRLEGWIDRLESELPPLRRFILAGGSPPARRCTSRARSADAPSARWWRSGPTRSSRTSSIYVNRLSDLLFVMARAANRRAGAAEIEW